MAGGVDGKPGSGGFAYARFDDDPQPVNIAEFAIVTGGSVEFRRIPWQSAS